MIDRLFADTYLASLYDLWHPRKVRSDFDFYLPRVMAADAVLDLGCGTGMMLHDARDAGHEGRLCGLDPAPGMLQRARRRKDIEWVLGDLPSTGWTAAFDLVVMTGHAFQAIVTDAELIELLAAIRRALVPQGRFAFETRNPAAGAWKEWKPANAEEIADMDGNAVRITTQVVKEFDGNTVTFTTAFTGDNPALPLLSESTLRFLDRSSLSSFLADASFVVEEQFGNWDGRPCADDGPEIITVARTV